MSGTSRRILILTASYGSGHTRAAGILADEFSRVGALPTVVDHFRDLVHPAFDRWSRALYYGILHRAPAVWGGAYWLGDRINVKFLFTSSHAPDDLRSSPEFGTILHMMPKPWDVPHLLAKVRELLGV